MKMHLTLAACVAAALCSAGAAAAGTDGPSRGSFQFAPLPSSTACTTGGDPAAPFTVPPGFSQTIVASEPAYADSGDMNTLNETGKEAGRFLYRPSEGAIGEVSVTDLWTGVTKRLAFHADWEAMDTIAWSPWGTILVGEERNAQTRPDPQVPQAIGGLMYEIFLDQYDPSTAVAVVPRPALGAKSHEGSRFDPQGNYYGISERSPGYIFKFTPDRRGDLSSGQLYALKIAEPTEDRTGGAVWVPLDRAAVQVDASAVADAAQATGYNRPEDVEIATSTGNNRGGANTLYVAVTGRGVPYDNRVLAIDLRGETPFVYDYVREGLNVPFGEFEMPDNLALDHNGNLFIAEDPGTASVTRRGDDIWAASPPRAVGHNLPADSVVRFASLTDCQAEPTGIYFDLGGTTLYVNAQHRGGDGLDKAVAITPAR